MIFARAKSRAKKVALFLVSFGVLLAGGTATQAAPGDLDPAFARTGKTRVGFGGGVDEGSATAVQTDGKLLVAGWSFNASKYEFSIARNNTAGSLDISFDGDGKTFQSFGSSDAFATSVEVQADGKIVVAGYAGSGGNSDFALARFNPDGSLDTSFGSAGKVTTDLGGSSDEAHAMLIQDDGKIVVAGSSHFENTYHFSVVRYNPDGSLDTSFDRDGIVITDFSSNGSAGNAVGIQPDGKLIVAGYASFSFPGSTDFAVARYNTNGFLDGSFGDGGKVITSVGPGPDEATAVTIESGDATPLKIVVAGTTRGESSSGYDYDFAVVRYNNDGSLDTAFVRGVNNATGVAVVEVYALP